MPGSFYAETIAALNIPRNASVLVVCGGQYDRDCLAECGFTDVTISNLDERVIGNEFYPFHWSFQDAEHLAFPDKSFDFVFVHAGLHHCASPHRALLEMYRVAKAGILVFESRDSFLMRFAIKAGRVPAYEACAVRSHSFRYGGVRNSAVPNFIYRWTETEVAKTISSYAPQSPHHIRFFYGLRLPVERIPFRQKKSLLWLSVFIERTIEALFQVMRTQGNMFAFFIEKPEPDTLQPWMKSQTEFDETYTGI